jgi:hypothetical protein
MGTNARIKYNYHGNGENIVYFGKEGADEA